MSGTTQPSLRGVVVLIAVSAPLALGFETALRKLVFAPLIGADLEAIREFYWPAWTPELREAALTQVAFVLVGGSVLAGLLGVALLRRAVRRSGGNDREGARAKLRDSLLLLSSIPQVPAILATLCFSFGARLLPVVISMAVSTAFVLVQGFVGERSLDQLRGIEPGPRPC